MASIGAKRVCLTVMLTAAVAFAADTKKEFRYTAGPGSMVIIANEFGPVTVHPSTGRQVVITATTHSDKAEVDAGQTGNRVEARTHLLGQASESDARVDYDVQVPADVMLNVHADGGPIRVEKLRSDMTLEGDAAEISVQDCSNARLHVHTVTGPVTLANISNGFVEVTSPNGNVQLTSVTGPRVTVNTTKGNIRYTGDFAGGGEYLLNNHSGDIDVLLPTSASVDISARSVTGAVEQDFPLQQKQHLAYQLTPGRSFAGTSNSGASSVQLRSFSGKIRVKKQ